MSVSVLPKGTQFARLALVVGRARNDVMTAQRVAQAEFGDGSPVASVLRTAVSMGTLEMQQWPEITKALVEAGNTTPTGWAAPLAAAQSIQDDYIEAVAARSVVNRLALRRLPSNIVMRRQTTRGRGAFVGQGEPYQVTRPGMDTILLGTKKIGAIVVTSETVLTLAPEVAVPLIRNDLVNIDAATMDAAFFDPAQAGIPDVAPASITYGLTPLNSSGSVAADLEALIDAYQGDLQTAVWVSDALTATQVGLRSGGSNSINVGARGGEALGISWLVSSGMPRSTAGGRILILDQSQVAITADQAVEIAFSRNAALQMNDDPSAGAAPLETLWQQDLCAYRLTHFIDWSPPPAGAAVLLEGAEYTA